jgi:methylaspartate mutase epsilon subunit
MEKERACGRLVLQPRMGFSQLSRMRRGLEAVHAIQAPTIGTITIDSKTRTGDLEGARRAIDLGKELNGYPIAAYDAVANQALVAGLHGESFPIQVRHGSAVAEPIFEATIMAGLDATEGGPISYCLPYSRTPLSQSLVSWDRCCRMLASLREKGTIPHLESFGGCMLGQLCPPSLLLAIVLLEGRFFAERGLPSISLSYAQGTDPFQDVGALRALRKLAAQYLPKTTWHVVFYTFMGLFPETHAGALRLIEDSVEVALLGEADRLIVKTASEAHQIPRIGDNVEALETCARAASSFVPVALPPQVDGHGEMIREQARHLVDAVLDLDRSLGRSIEIAFARGYLDVPYCLHSDNRNEARSWLDDGGSIYWATTGNLLLPPHSTGSAFRQGAPIDSRSLLRMLSFNRDKYDLAQKGEREVFSQAGAEPRPASRSTLAV